MTNSASSSDAAAHGFFKLFLPRGEQKLLFVFVMTCYVFMLQTLMARSIRLLGLWPEITDPVTHVQRFLQPEESGNRIVHLICLLITSPIDEPLTLIIVIEIVRRLKLSVTIQIIVSASIVCLLYSTQYWFWGLVVAPAFLIHAGTYLYWRRTSIWTGVYMTVALHFFINILPASSTIASLLNR